MGSKHQTPGRRGDNRIIKKAIAKKVEKYYFFVFHETYVSSDLKENVEEQCNGSVVFVTQIKFLPESKSLRYPRVCNIFLCMIWNMPSLVDMEYVFSIDGRLCVHG